MVDSMQHPSGVLGAGSFGITIARLLAVNGPVLLYARQKQIVDEINQFHTYKGYNLTDSVRATDDISYVTDQCNVIFPVVPSANFRELMQFVSPYLKPSHFLIHCTKGFDLLVPEIQDNNDSLVSRKNVKTMSEVIMEETVVLRIGCLSGPNLAKEILDGQPTATVVASEFDEVIEEGQRLLTSQRFYVFGSYDMIGAELAGIFKNVIALGSGYLAGRDLGKNMQAMLITRGLHEMVYFGKAMGAETRAFLGTAGVGDLIATATSKDSRNFTFGYRLGQGEKMNDIASSMEEVAEGVRTLEIAHHLAEYYKMRVPITDTLYRVIFQGYDFDKALDYLMRYKYAWDVDFI
jgi:glycerol-3-phosphate dehydrogenase (NAD(P)+)